MPTTTILDYSNLSGTAANATLESVTGKVGGPFNKHAVINGASAVWGGAFYGQGDVVYYAAVAATGDYTFNLSPQSYSAGGNLLCCMSQNTTADTMYRAGWFSSGAADNNGFWAINRTIAGVTTTLVSVAGTLPRASDLVGNVIAVTKVYNTGQITVLLNGVQKCTFTDPSPLPETGRFGPSFQTTVGHYSYTATQSTVAALAIADLTLTPRDDGVTLSGGDVTGGVIGTKTITLDRSTDPVFTSFVTLTTNATLPYTDTSILAGQVYYYRPTVTDGTSTVVGAIVAGGRTVTPQGFMPNATLPALCVLWLGTSIDYGVATSDPATKSPPARAAITLATRGIAPVIVNRASTGFGLQDYLASTATPVFSGPTWSQIMADYGAAIALNPGAKKVCVFGGMGPNDAAASGKAGSPATATTFKNNYRTVIEQLLSAHPTITIVINRPTWHSPSIVGGYTYTPASLALLEPYWQATLELIAEYASSRPKQVRIGDTDAFVHFANYATTLLVAETGSDSKAFRLHPNDTGSDLLGSKFQSWALFNHFAVSTNTGSSFVPSYNAKAGNYKVATGRSIRDRSQPAKTFTEGQNLTAAVLTDTDIAAHLASGFIVAA